jgi:hypothetical protein
LAHFFNKLPTRVGRPARAGERIPVVIRGYIDGIWSQDDGESREFSVHVEKVEVELP